MIKFVVTSYYPEIESRVQTQLQEEGMTHADATSEARASVLRCGKRCYAYTNKETDIKGRPLYEKDIHIIHADATSEARASVLRCGKRHYIYEPKDGYLEKETFT